jgi:hypothetical protein
LPELNVSLFTILACGCIFAVGHMAFIGCYWWPAVAIVGLAFSIIGLVQAQLEAES